MESAFLLLPIRVSIALRAVPPSAPFVPLLARIPSATPVSFALTPNVLAAPPAFIYASIICCEFMFEEFCAFVTISRYSGKSLTCNFKALIESVTRSEQVARSIFDAALSFRTGCNADVDSFTFHPASAIYPSASALSFAVFVVAFPASLAASLSCSCSVCVAFAIAAVFASDCS